MTCSPIFCSNLRVEGNYPIQTIICRLTTAKWSRIAVQITGLRWGPWSLGRLPVTVFKLLNDRQSEFRESSEAIISICELRSFKRFKKIFSIISIRICRIAVRSWHQSRDILPIKRDACSWPEIFSTRECGLFWALFFFIKKSTKEQKLVLKILITIYTRVFFSVRPALRLPGYTVIEVMTHVIFL